MKQKLILLITCSLAGLFAFGGMCGYALAAHELPRFGEGQALPKSEEVWLERRYQETVERVALSPDQAAKLRAHYRTLAADIRVIREETGQRLTAAFARHREAVLPDFTPEQRKRYEALSSERRMARQHESPASAP